jgi:RNA polymerase sigma factor (sigma-70 family)
VPDNLPADFAPDALDDLLQQAQIGLPTALQGFFDRYASTFLQAIRARLDGRMRSEWDSTDFMQRARLRLLLAGIEKLHFCSAASLVAFIKKIAVNEVLREKRKRHNQMKATGQIVALTPDAQQWLTDRAASVFDKLVAADRWANTLAQLPPDHCKIAELFLIGYTQVEIAAKLGISERTVRSVVAKLRSAMTPGPSED